MQEMQEIRDQSLGQEDALRKEMSAHSSILVLRIPWPEEPDGLLTMGFQRVRCNWVTNTLFINEIKLKHTGKWALHINNTACPTVGSQNSDMTEHVHAHEHTHTWETTLLQYQTSYFIYLIVQLVCSINSKASGMKPHTFLFCVCQFLSMYDL